MTPKFPSDGPLRSSETEFRAVFEQSALGMARVQFVDARWVDVNNTFCQMLGRSRDEMLSTPWPDMTHPDDVEPDRIFFKKMAAGELDSYTVEKRFLHAKGHHVWAKLTLSLVRDAKGDPDYEIAIIEDIADRKANEQALAQSRLELEAERKRLQTIVDTIPTGLIILDENGAMVLENAEWKRTWAGNALLNSVVDYDSYKGFRPDTGERISAEEWPCAVSLKQGIKTRDVILDIERFNGTRGTIVVSSAPIRDEAGRVVAAVAANMDISELRATQAKLVDADRRKDQFLAMLAHELRNPLAPISSAAALLKLSDLPPHHVRATADIISRQVNHMTGLVDDLLDVSRVTTGFVSLIKENVDIRRVIADAVEQVRPLIESRHHDLSVQMGMAPADVLGDYKRLVQVLSNLLNNAAKYTPDGGKILVQLDTENDTVVIQVSDNGMGISQALLPNIFDLFSQAERTSDRSQGGLGLGLALVKSLVELHGGQVLVKSEGNGSGSQFRVTLPLLGKLDSEHPSNTDLSQHSEPKSRQTRLLVVDDNVDAAEMLGMFLQVKGYRVAVEHDPNKALERATREEFDAYLLDIGLPGMDGNELARRLRGLPKANAAMMVAITGYGNQFDRDTSIKAGFDEYVVKPADPGKILQLLNSISQDHDAARVK